MRRSDKWAGYGPGVISATIAEMDFPLADPIVEVLHAAIARHDLGYTPGDTTRLAKAFEGSLRAASELDHRSRAGDRGDRRDDRHARAGPPPDRVDQSHPNSASFCGVYGLRPSVGVVPLTGFQPPGPARPLRRAKRVTYRRWDRCRRTSADLRTALSVTAGPEDPTAKAFSWALAPPRHQRLRDFRVAVVLDDARSQVTAQVGAVHSDAVDALARAGVRVVEGWPTGIDPGQVTESFGFQIGLFFAVQAPGEEEFAPLSAVIEQEQRRMAAELPGPRTSTKSMCSYAR